RHCSTSSNLITAVFPHLSECDRICLENAVINFQEDTDYPEDIALVEQYLVYERKSILRREWDLWINSNKFFSESYN
ncbi:hypothetical protein, partial [Spirulina sp. 06S082]|uniref:hypothetical protein n=1 Tax=Spirulina sp. 06S082 TaxID=3110248 RepID=UPI002B20F97B